MNLNYSSVISQAHYHHAEFRVLEKKLKLFYEQGKSKFFDVGFGRGKFLDLASSYGYEVYGVEVSEEYLESAKLKGYRCFHVDDILHIKEKFDVVFISHVIEHLEPSELINALSLYIDMLKDDGVIIIASPLIGDRFYYDITHTRPYYPQSIWHSFGENKEEISTGRESKKIHLNDIYFVRDCFRTRKSRAYYIRDGLGAEHALLRILNYSLALIYLLSGYRIGLQASWIGFYSKKKAPVKRN